MARRKEPDLSEFDVRPEDLEELGLQPADLDPPARMQQHDARAPAQPDAADIIRTAMQELAALEDERARLVERKKGALAPLFDELALSKKAVAAFLQRQRLTAEDRAAFDSTFNRLCIALDEPFQPDLFDELVKQEISTGAGASHITH